MTRGSERFLRMMWPRSATCAPSQSILHAPFTRLQVRAAQLAGEGSARMSKGPPPGYPQPSPPNAGPPPGYPPAHHSNGYGHHGHAPHPHPPPQYGQAHAQHGQQPHVVVVEEPLFHEDHLCADVCCAVWTVCGFPISLCCSIPYFLVRACACSPSNLSSYIFPCASAERILTTHNVHVAARTLHAHAQLCNRMRIVVCQRWRTTCRHACVAKARSSSTSDGAVESSYVDARLSLMSCRAMFCIPQDACASSHACIHPIHRGAWCHPNAYAAAQHLAAGCVQARMTPKRHTSTTHTY